MTMMVSEIVNAAKLENIIVIMGILKKKAYSERATRIFDS